MSVAKTLMAGRILGDQLFPYPRLRDKDREVLGLMIDAIDQFLGPRQQDFKRWDREAAQPAEFIQGLRDLGLFGLIIPEEHGGLGRLALDALGYFPARHPRHAEIGDHHVVCGGVEHLDRLLAIGRGRHGVALAAQHVGQHGEEPWIVVHQEYPRRERGPRAPIGRPAGGGDDLEAARVQPQPHRGALADRAVDGHAASVPLDDVVDLGQPLRGPLTRLEAPRVLGQAPQWCSLIVSQDSGNAGDADIAGRSRRNFSPGLRDCADTSRP